MEHAALAARGVGADGARNGEELFESLAGGAVVGPEVQEVVVAHQEDALFVAREQALAAFQDLLEHRLAVGDRAADHAQHLGRRRLLLERLLGLVEEARVLDRDHGLVGEGLEQGDLARQERAGLFTRHGDRADAAIIEQQGGEQYRLHSCRQRAAADPGAVRPARRRRDSA